MTSLLHLDSSANRSGQSVSRRLTGLFVGTWQRLNGTVGYRYRDLVSEPVPPLDTGYCTLGRRLERHGLVAPSKVTALIVDRAEAQQWAMTRPLIEELLAADTVLIGAPMYNYSVPASLKAWIDRVGFPGAFIDADTGDSVLRDTKIVVISARGGAYGSDSRRQAWDFQTPYLRAYFAKQGVAETNLYFINAELTLAGLAPHLAHLKPRATASLAAAERLVTAVATELATPAGVSK